MGAGGDAETNPNTNYNNSSRSAGMKALKLPTFNEDKDDLYAYLLRFERACTAFEVRQEHRSTQLARLLQGKALDVYQCKGVRCPPIFSLSNLIDAGWL